MTMKAVLKGTKEKTKMKVIGEIRNKTIKVETIIREAEATISLEVVEEVMSIQVAEEAMRMLAEEVAMTIAMVEAVIQTEEAVEAIKREQLVNYMKILTRLLRNH